MSILLQYPHNSLVFEDWEVEIGLMYRKSSYSVKLIKSQVFCPCWCYGHLHIYTKKERKKELHLFLGHKHWREKKYKYNYLQQNVCNFKCLCSLKPTVYFIPPFRSETAWPSFYFRCKFFSVGCRSKAFFCVGWLKSTTASRQDFNHLNSVSLLWNCGDWSSHEVFCTVHITTVQ